MSRTQLLYKWISGHTQKSGKLEGKCFFQTEWLLHQATAGSELVSLTCRDPPPFVKHEPLPQAHPLKRAPPKKKEERKEKGYVYFHTLLKKEKENQEFISSNLKLKNIFLIEPDLIVQYFVYWIRSLIPVEWMPSLLVCTPRMRNSGLYLQRTKDKANK